MTSAAHAFPPLPLYPPPDPHKYRLETVSVPVRRSGTGLRLARGNRIQRAGVATLVVFAHLAGLATLAHLASRPVVVPELTSITLALIPAEPAVQPVSPTPVETPAPPAPPPPKVEKADPPKPQPPKPAPTPKPKPHPAPLPKVTESPTALTQEAHAPEPSPPAPAEPAAVAPAAQPTPPAAAAPAAAAPITAARFDAAYLNNPAPAYPMLSRRLREEGQVMLRVLVSPDGRPNRIELRTSSGSERLDRAAEEAVARWRFVPARQGEAAVEAWVLVPIVFKLKGN